MSWLDSQWLADQMARIVDSPANSRTVLTTHVNYTSSSSYVEAVRNHIGTLHAREEREQAPPQRSQDQPARG